MSEEPRNGVSGMTIAIVGGIVFLLAYALSPMPVFVFISLMGLSESEWVQTAVVTVYTPLSWVAERCPALEAFYAYQGELCEKVGVSP